jgi:hypothetical protein
LGEEKKGAIYQGSKKKSEGTERPAGGKATNNSKARKRTYRPTTTLKSSKKATHTLSTKNSNAKK